MKTVHIALTALLTALALTVLPSSALAFGPSISNTFKTLCTPTFTQPVQMDPIVHPGLMTGHLHEFFGNTQINDSSTGQQLQADGAAAHTTCKDRFDTAAYWVPALYRNGVRVPPRGVDVYYERIDPLNNFDGNPFNSDTEPPTDFRMVAGNHEATSPQKQSVVKWNCLGDNVIKSYTAPPACVGSSAAAVSGQVIFPACWDGTSARNADNAMLTAYEINNGLDTTYCPQGFGTQIPKLLLTIHYSQDAKPDCHLVAAGVPCDHYTLSEQLPDGSLSDQGSIYGYHADFLNGWNDGPDTVDPQDQSFAGLIARCDNQPEGQAVPCGVQGTVPTGDAFAGGF